ncbi:MAG: trigger factor [Planctomycetota bacterium]|nr:MAG: trigger factor [Planctomycetota bacterium]
MVDEDIQDPQVDEIDEAEEVEVEEEKKSLEDRLTEAVEVEVDDVGSLRKKVTITIPRETLDEEINEQYGELRREALVPGFRKGRAPRRLLEKRFGNEVNETLVQQLVGAGYKVATEKEDLKVIGDPLIWVREEGAESETLVEVNKAIDVIKIPDDGSLAFSCEVEVRPEFELPEVEGIPIEKPVLTVTDEDVDTQVKRLCAMRGTYEAASDGKVKADDMLTVDLTVTSDGSELKKDEQVRLAARPQVVEGITLEKLGEVLSGAKVGDVRSVSADIPDDYTKAEFRGKQADFEIAIRDIQRLKVPEFDDQFVKGIGFETQQEVRDWLKSDLESRLVEQVRQAMAGEVYKYLLDKTEFELPERLSERQTDRVVARRMLELYRQGVPPAEVEKHMDEMRTSAREQAAHDLKLAFIMESLSEKFEVEVTEAEINGAIAAIAQRQGQRFDRVRDQLIKQDGIANLYVQLRDEKIVEQLIEKAKITEKEPEKKKAKAKEKKTLADKTTKSRPKRKSPAKTKGKKADDFADET